MHGPIIASKLIIIFLTSILCCTRRYLLVIYIKEVDPTELQTPPRNCVENRLLTFGKKYAEKKLRLKETFYQDMMKDRP